MPGVGPVTYGELLRFPRSGRVSNFLAITGSDAARLRWARRGSQQNPILLRSRGGFVQAVMFMADASLLELQNEPIWIKDQPWSKSEAVDLSNCVRCPQNPLSDAASVRFRLCTRSA